MTAPPFFQITFTVDGVTVIDRVLAGIAERAQDIRPAVPALIDVFQRVVAKAFDTEGASTGAPWDELKESTQKDRARRGFPPAHPILERSGKLRRALTMGEGANVSTTPTSVRYVLSSEVDYFKYHQSIAPRTKLPRRAPVLLTEDDKHAIMRPVRLWITGRDPNAVQRSAIT